MLSSAFKSTASVQEVVTFSKCVDQATMSRQETNESLQPNQSIAALEPSAKDLSNSRICSTYPSQIIQDPTMQMTDPIVMKSSPNSVAVTRSKSKSKSEKCAAPISVMQSAQTIGPSKSDRMSTEDSSIASTHKSSTSSELKTTSTKSRGSRASKSLKSAKVKMAVTLSKLKSQADIHALEMQQCQERAKYEQEKLAQTCRREEQERQKRAKYEQERLAQTCRREEQERTKYEQELLVQTCSREEQERRFQHRCSGFEPGFYVNSVFDLSCLVSPYRFSAFG